LNLPYKVLKTTDGLGVWNRRYLNAYANWSLLNALAQLIFDFQLISKRWSKVCSRFDFLEGISRNSKITLKLSFGKSKIGLEQDLIAYAIIHLLSKEKQFRNILGLLTTYLG